jgi:hypothetical protein
MNIIELAFFIANICFAAWLCSFVWRRVGGWWAVLAFPVGFGLAVAFWVSVGWLLQRLFPRRSSRGSPPK